MMKVNDGLRAVVSVFLFVCLLGSQGLYAQHKSIDSRAELTRIKFNHPGLTVELGVGLCSLPMALDYNGDGLVDLIVTAGQDVPDGYTYFF